MDQYVIPMLIKIETSAKEDLPILFQYLDQDGNGIISSGFLQDKAPFYRTRPKRGWLLTKENLELIL